VADPESGKRGAGGGGPFTLKLTVNFKYFKNFAVNFKVFFQITGCTAHVLPAFDPSMHLSPYRRNLGGVL
jgi:hypothetical protein